MSDRIDYKRRRRQRIRDELAEVRARRERLRPSRPPETVLVPLLDLPWHDGRRKPWAGDTRDGSLGPVHP